MKTMLFDGPGLNPMCYRSFPFRAIVKNGIIHTDWHDFRFAGEAYPDGTEVEVSLGRYVECISVAERISRDEQLRVIAEERLAAAKIKRDRQNAANVQFNDSLRVPVEWHPQHKPVLSGLSERSAGDGCNRRTVYHIYFDEDLSFGRIKRKAGSFLCSPSIGRHFNDCISGGGDKEVKVTCKSCLEKAKRFKNDQH